MDKESLIYTFNVSGSCRYLVVTSPEIPGLEISMGSHPLADVRIILETAMQAVMGPRYPSPAQYRMEFEAGEGRLSPHSALRCIFRPTGGP